MNSELSFLIELLLKHKLPPATKDLIAGRIKDVEQSLCAPRSLPANPVRLAAPVGAQQAASTQAILDRNPDLLQPPALVTPAVIAQTPAAAAAIADRQAAITQSMSGKPEKGRTSPRKF
jgi:hypothetical protein